MAHVLKKKGRSRKCKNISYLICYKYYVIIFKNLIGTVKSCLSPYIFFYNKYLHKKSKLRCSKKLIGYRRHSKESVETYNIQNTKLFYLIEQ